MKNLLSSIFDANGVEESEAYSFARETMQKIILNGLSRGQFFKKAAFHGGTALRILHGINRYSEDLDFTLFEKDPDFKLERYLTYAESEIRSYGVTVSTKVRDKVVGNIRTGDVKANYREMAFEIGFPNGLVESLHRDEVIRVKIDVNTDPPKGAGYDKLAMTEPLNYYLCAMDLPSMFAGKIGAILGRRWVNRVKGRDLYDYLWYVEKEVPINMEYLRSNLVAQEIIQQEDEFTIKTLRQLLSDKFETIKYASALEDVKEYLLERAPVGWCPETFKDTLGWLYTQ